MFTAYNYYVLTLMIFRLDQFINRYKLSIKKFHFYLIETYFISDYFLF